MTFGQIVASSPKFCNQCGRWMPGHESEAKPACNYAVFVQQPQGLFMVCGGLSKELAEQLAANFQTSHGNDFGWHYHAGIVA